MKYTVLNENSVFDLRNFNLYDIFQECNPGVKWDLPVPDYLSNNAPAHLLVLGEAWLHITMNTYHQQYQQNQGS